MTLRLSRSGLTSGDRPAMRDSRFDEPRWLASELGSRGFDELGHQGVSVVEAVEVETSWLGAYPVAPREPHLLYYTVFIQFARGGSGGVAGDGSVRLCH